MSRQKLQPHCQSAQVGTPFNKTPDTPSTNNGDPSSPASPQSLSGTCNPEEAISASNSIPLPTNSHLDRFMERPKDKEDTSIFGTREIKSLTFPPIVMSSRYPMIKSPFISPEH